VHGPELGVSIGASAQARIFKGNLQGPGEMDRDHLDAMSIDELWALHTDVDQILTVKLIAAKSDLEERLKQLGRRADWKGRIKRNDRARVIIRD